MKNMDKLDTLPFVEYRDRLFKRLEEVVSYEALSREEQEQYDRDWKWAADYEETALYQFDQGYAKGEAEGRAEGIAEGELKGKWEDARNFYNLGVDIDTIAKATGLPIESLIKELVK